MLTALFCIIFGRGGEMEKVYEFHQEEYGENPASVAEAPGRFHLIGEHSWFFKDKTLSMAVNFPVRVAVSLRDDGNLRFYYPQLKEKKRSTLSTMKYRKEDRWANAIKCVVYGFNSAGFACQGMNFTVDSEILPSAGFGITTAIKVAAAWAIKDMMGFKCTKAQLLQVIEKGNKFFLGQENYKADIFTAVFSKENNIVLTDHNEGTYELLPFNFKDKVILLTDARVPRIVTWNEECLQQPENGLLLGDLKLRKSNVLGGWVYEDNGSEINETLSVVSEELRRRLICIMKEHKYVLEAQSSLSKKEFSGFARAVNKSHENMRDNYEISCPEIDWLLKRVGELDPSIEDIRTPSNCGRITGKGFGRCIFTVLRKEDVESYKQKLVEYERIFGFKPECYEVKPVAGVHIL